MSNAISQNDHFQLKNQIQKKMFPTDRDRISGTNVYARFTFTTQTTTKYWHIFDRFDQW